MPTTLADPATPVAWCPGWDLTTLAAHVGATHRWVTAMVAGGTSWMALNSMPMPTKGV